MKHIQMLLVCVLGFIGMLFGVMAAVDLFSESITLFDSPKEDLALAGGLWMLGFVIFMHLIHSEKQEFEHGRANSGTNGSGSGTGTSGHQRVA